MHVGIDSMFIRLYEILNCFSDHHSSNLFLKLLIDGAFTTCWGRLFQALITLWGNEFLIAKRDACFLKILRLWPLVLELSAIIKKQFVSIRTDWCSTLYTYIMSPRFRLYTKRR